MENFLTWDILLTFSGCVAGTVLLTEWLKKMLPKLPAQLISFVIALLILMVGHLAMGDFAWAETPLYLVNAVAVSLTANGGFDILKNAFGKTAVVADELVIAGEGTRMEETYLNLSKELKDFKDGEVVSFKVTKVDSQD